MTAPTTVDDFVRFVRKSELLDQERFATYLESTRARGDYPATSEQLAQALIRDEFLTYYQAEQLLAGRYKSFYVGGKYKVLERLGVGGMASVYLCEHRVMRRLVALKVLPRVGADDPSTLERFHREARAVARLHHPNIVDAYDVDQQGKLNFLVMEYVDGVNLEDYVAHLGPLEPGRAAHYVTQAALGLHHAHGAGMVHRDIKPSNLLIDRSGTVKILDMGLARLFHDESDNLTRSSDVQLILGTLDFLAPEQVVDSHDVDIRADIFSLGATLYYLLTGRGPFHEATTAKKLAGLHFQSLTPLRDIRPDVPLGLASVIGTMLALDPSRRHQTPLEVVEALAPWVKASVPPPIIDIPRPLSPAARSTIQHATHRTPKPGKSSTHSPLAVSTPLTAAPSPTSSVGRPAGLSWRSNLARNPRFLRAMSVAGLVILAIAGLGLGAKFLSGHPARPEPAPAAASEAPGIVTDEEQDALAEPPATPVPTPRDPSTTAANVVRRE